MATQGISDLISTLETSLKSALEAVPDEALLAPTKDGISLLDTKNEIFLGYLQNLVFLILFKIRQLKDGSSEQDEDETRQQKKIWDGTVENLVKLRVYADKGVKPIENRLRYEIDRVVQAAEDAANAADAQANGAKKDDRPKKKKKGRKDRNELDNSVNGLDVSGDENGKEAINGDLDSEDDLLSADDDWDDEGESLDAPAFKPASRPNLANFRLPGASPPDTATNGSGTRPRPGERIDASTSSGAYRPPRVAPTLMPTTTAGSAAERRARKAGRVRSSALDEYVAEELSGAPAALPSVGSNIERAGRATQTAAQRRVADERRAYEEANFVRLPAASKKERQQQQRHRADGLASGFGGEDWRELGAGAERVVRELDQRSRDVGALERSRKRGHDDFGMGGSGGAGPGKSSFEKRRRTLQKRSRK